MDVPQFFHTLTEAKHRPWLIGGAIGLAALAWLAFRGGSTSVTADPNAATNGVDPSLLDPTAGLTDPTAGGDSPITPVLPVSPIPPVVYPPVAPIAPTGSPTTGGSKSAPSTPSGPGAPPEKAPTHTEAQSAPTYSNPVPAFGATPGAASVFSVFGQSILTPQTNPEHAPSHNEQASSSSKPKSNTQKHQAVAANRANAAMGSGGDSLPAAFAASAEMPGEYDWHTNPGHFLDALLPPDYGG